MWYTGAKPIQRDQRSYSMTPSNNLKSPKKGISLSLRPRLQAAISKDERKQPRRLDFAYNAAQTTQGFTVPSRDIRSLSANTTVTRQIELSSIPQTKFAVDSSNQMFSTAPDSLAFAKPQLKQYSQHQWFNNNNGQMIIQQGSGNQWFSSTSPTVESNSQTSWFSTSNQQGFINIRHESAAPISFLQDNKDKSVKPAPQIYLPQAQNQLFFKNKAENQKREVNFEYFQQTFPSREQLGPTNTSKNSTTIPYQPTKSLRQQPMHPFAFQNQKRVLISPQRVVIPSSSLNLPKNMPAYTPISEPSQKFAQPVTSYTPVNNQNSPHMLNEQKTQNIDKTGKEKSPKIRISIDLKPEISKQKNNLSKALKGALSSGKSKKIGSPKTGSPQMKEYNTGNTEISSPLEGQMITSTKKVQFDETQTSYFQIHSDQDMNRANQNLRNKNQEGQNYYGSSGFGGYQQYPVYSNPSSSSSPVQEYRPSPFQNQSHFHNTNSDCIAPNEDELPQMASLALKSHPLLFDSGSSEYIDQNHIFSDICKRNSESLIRDDVVETMNESQTSVVEKQLKCKDIIQQDTINFREKEDIIKSLTTQLLSFQHSIQYLANTQPSLQSHNKLQHRVNFLNKKTSFVESNSAPISKLPQIFDPNNSIKAVNKLKKTKKVRVTSQYHHFPSSNQIKDSVISINTQKQYQPVIQALKDLKVPLIVSSQTISYQQPNQSFSSNSLNYSPVIQKMKLQKIQINSLTNQKQFSLNHDQLNVISSEKTCNPVLLQSQSLQLDFSDKSQSKKHNIEQTSSKLTQIPIIQGINQPQSQNSDHQINQLQNQLPIIPIVQSIDNKKYNLSQLLPRIPHVKGQKVSNKDINLVIPSKAKIISEEHLIFQSQQKIGISVVEEKSSIIDQQLSRYLIPITPELTLGHRCLNLALTPAKVLVSVSTLSEASELSHEIAVYTQMGLLPTPLPHILELYGVLTNGPNCVLVKEPYCSVVNAKYQSKYANDSSILQIQSSSSEEIRYQKPSKKLSDTGQFRSQQSRKIHNGLEYMLQNYQQQTNTPQLCLSHKNQNNPFSMDYLQGVPIRSKQIDAIINQNNPTSIISVQGNSFTSAQDNLSKLSSSQFGSPILSQKINHKKQQLLVASDQSHPLTSSSSKSVKIESRINKSNLKLRSVLQPDCYLSKQAIQQSYSENFPYQDLIQCVQELLFALQTFQLTLSRAPKPSDFVNIFHKFKLHNVGLIKDKKDVQQCQSDNDLRNEKLLKQFLNSIR